MLVESQKDDIEFLKDNLENSTTANSITQQLYFILI